MDWMRKHYAGASANYYAPLAFGNGYTNIGNSTRGNQPDSEKNVWRLRLL